MPTLVVKELTRSQKEQLEQSLAVQIKPGRDADFVVQAGAHLIKYSYGREIQADIYAYAVQVSGPHDLKITHYLQGRDLAYRGQPYNAGRDWYVFEEIGLETVTFHIVDLVSGNVALFQHPAIAFTAWRPGTSELIFRDFSRLNIDSWFGFDVVSSQSRCLFVGGNTAFVSRDGQFLLVIAPAEVFVALIELSIGKIIWRVLKQDFASFVESAAQLSILYFDAEISTLYALLSGAGTDYEKAVSIEINS